MFVYRIITVSFVAADGMEAGACKSHGQRSAVYTIDRWPGDRTLMPADNTCTTHNRPIIQ